MIKEEALGWHDCDSKTGKTGNGAILFIKIHLVKFILHGMELPKKRRAVVILLFLKL